MSSELPWMAAAINEIGQKEIPGANSNIRIMHYRTLAGCTLRGDDGDVPWCRIFVCAMLHEAGLPYLKNWMARSAEHDPNLVKLAGPAYGAIVTYWRGTPRGGLGHTDFYVGSANGRIYGLGGNQGDAVNIEGFPAHSAHFGVNGFYWPKGFPVPDVGPVAWTGKLTTGTVSAV
jgi:uncharacterized protein (TIGR02594 family)